MGERKQREPTSPSQGGREEPIALGVYQHGAPWQMEPLEEFEKHAGRGVDIVMWYQDWATTREIDVGMIERVAAHGAFPMLTWEPWDYRDAELSPPPWWGRAKGSEAAGPAFPLDRIAAGHFDDYVRESARRIARYGGPLLLRWAHEMNGGWYPWGVGAPGASPETYRQAWRHVWELFRDEAATNVSWVWSPNILDHCAAFEPFYPGADCVDWLGLDGYNLGGWGRWRSFRRLFAASYARVADLGPQPIMIAETACAEAGGNKACWIAETLTHAIPTEFPRVHALIWFNANKERDWRIESSRRSQRAFADAIAAVPFRSS